MFNKLASALLTNTRRGWEWLTLANNYYGTAKVTAVNKLGLFLKYNVGAHSRGALS